VQAEKMLELERGTVPLRARVISFLMHLLPDPNY